MSAKAISQSRLAYLIKVADASAVTQEADASTRSEMCDVASALRELEKHRVAKCETCKGLKGWTEVGGYWMPCPDCAPPPVLPGMSERPHADDIAVNGFAEAMRAKLAKKRAQGYGGWDDATECTVDSLARLLLNHLPKGDPVDIANFAMMLHFREGGPDALRQLSARLPATPATSDETRDAARWRFVRDDDNDDHVLDMNDHVRRGADLVDSVDYAMRARLSGRSL